MAEACQKREFEQQELLQEMMGDAYSYVDVTDHDTFFLTLAVYLIGKLIARRLGEKDGVVPSYLSIALEAGSKHIKDYATTEADRIGLFARTPEEEYELLSRFIEKLLPAGFSEIRRAYLHQQVHAPERLYEGHKAMDEVPFLAEG